jgi:hypothetical protein
MVKDAQRLAEFEHADVARPGGGRNYAQALALFESLWNEARALQAVPPADPLAGVETDIEIARTLNALPQSGHV